MGELYHLGCCTMSKCYHSILETRRVSRKTLVEQQTFEEIPLDDAAPAHQLLALGVAHLLEHPETPPVWSVTDIAQIGADGICQL